MFAVILRPKRAARNVLRSRVVPVALTASIGCGSLVFTSAAYAWLPENISPPTISGTAQQGQTLTEKHGGWTNFPSGYEYQWLRCNSSGTSCAAISGASNETYVPLAEDVGHTLRVQEIASNIWGPSAPAESTATAVVVPPVPASPPADPPSSGGPRSVQLTPVVMTFKSVTVNRQGEALIPVSCPATASDGCEGTIAIRLGGPPASVKRVFAARCGRGCRPIGSAHYEARAGRRLDVRVHIASYVRGRLRRNNPMRVTLTATSFAEGHSVTVVHTFALKTSA